MADFQFTSVPFDASGPIPAEYTCDGENVSPSLSWSTPPEGTESLALIVDDPDAPTPSAFTHWILFNLSPTLTSLPRSSHAGDPALNANGLAPKEGTNDFGDVSYGGPCPPRGENHRYFFSLYALDAPLDLSSGAKRNEVRHAIEGHVLAKAEHVGTYQRG